VVTDAVVKWKSRFRVIVRVALLRRSCASRSAGYRTWMSSCCRFMQGHDDRRNLGAFRGYLWRVGEQGNDLEITDKVIEEMTDWASRPLDVV
jgi:hypothetical protein